MAQEVDVKAENVKIVPVDPAGKYLLILEGFDGHTEELEWLKASLWEWVNSSKAPFFVVCVRQGTVRLEKVGDSND